MTPMTHNPLDGSRLSLDQSTDPAHWRGALWTFNPWTGTIRRRSDIESDPDGRGILAPGDGALPAYKVFACAAGCGNTVTSEGRCQACALKSLKIVVDTIDYGNGRVEPVGNVIPPVVPPVDRRHVERRSALDVQVAGSHYKDLKIQPVEYIHANGIPFIEGSVIKYVSRWRAKGGVKDLEKAKHFIELLIELENRAATDTLPASLNKGEDHVSAAQRNANGGSAAGDARPKDREAGREES